MNKATKPILKLQRTLTLFMHPLKSHKEFLLACLKLLRFSDHRSTDHQT